MKAAEIKHAVRRHEAGGSAASTATSPRVTPRRVRRICARHRLPGKGRLPQRAGKPSPPAGAEVRAVLDAHAAEPAGVARTAMNVRDAGRIISDGRACGIKDSGLVVPSAAKRRKRIGYERKYSNAVRHTDRHGMKDGRFGGFKPATYLGDASRRVTGAALSKEATENAAAVLRYAIDRFGAPASLPPLSYLRSEGLYKTGTKDLILDAGKDYWKRPAAALAGQLKDFAAEEKFVADLPGACRSFRQYFLESAMENRNGDRLGKRGDSVLAAWSEDGDFGHGDLATSFHGARVAG